MAAPSLPSEAVGTACGVLIYSVFCLASGLLLLWLVCTHNERVSYVSLLAFFSSLSTSASIAQQIHTIVSWGDIRVAQFEDQRMNPGNPEIAIAGASTGLDKVFFYIQFYCYNVQALLTLFWAGELGASVFKLAASAGKIRRHASVAFKSAAVLVPVIQVSLLKSEAVQAAPKAFAAIANIIMPLSLAGGSLLLFVILLKYIHSRRAFLSWNVNYGRSTRSNNSRHMRLSSIGVSPPPRPNIYDKWLVARFSLAFVALGVFELIFILTENGFVEAAMNTTQATEPDFSADAAKAVFSVFPPGATASLLTFIVFGTTRTFREYMWKLFVPAPIRRRFEAREAAKVGPSTTILVSDPRSGSLEDTDIGMQSPTTPGDEVIPAVIGLGDLESGAGRHAGLHDDRKRDTGWPIVSLKPAYSRSGSG